MLKWQKMVFDRCSSLQWQVVWILTGRPGRKKTTKNYCSSCTVSSSVLLKWCCRCCKPETEILMNRVDGFSDPVLPENNLTLSPWGFKLKYVTVVTERWDGNNRGQYLLKGSILYILSLKSDSFIIIFFLFGMREASNRQWQKRKNHEVLI